MNDIRRRAQELEDLLSQIVTEHMRLAEIQRVLRNERRVAYREIMQVAQPLLERAGDFDDMPESETDPDNYVVFLKVKLLRDLRDALSDDGP